MRASSAARSGVGARLPGNPDRDGGHDTGMSEDMRANSMLSDESSGRSLRSAPSSRQKVGQLMREGGLNSIRTVLIEKSLGVLTAENPIRKIAIRACFHPHFDRVVLGVIALNCVFLAMDSKAPGFAETTQGNVVKYSEQVFLALFCAEMAAKIIATGFRGHPNAYLADNWNRLDFFVVILGVLAALDLGNFSAIRVVRVLRPLRTLQGFAGMRRLVVTLLRSMPLLFDVTVLVSFLFFTFGLVGVQLYSGAFTSRCSTLANAPADCSLCGRSDAVDAATGCDVDACAASFAAAAESGWAPRWVATEADETCGGASSAKWPFVDAHSPAGYKCPAGSDASFCHGGFENPNYGITSFDNVADAWLTIFQCISLEGWTDVMYYAKDAVSPWSWVYFTSMIILGAFFAVNLALAVLFVSFVDGKQAAAAEGDESGARGGKGAMSALLAGEDQTEDAYQEMQLATLTGKLERVGTFNHGSGRKPIDMTVGDRVGATAVVESAETSAKTFASPPTSPASVATPSGVGASFGSISNRVTPLPASKMRSRTHGDAGTGSPSGGRTPWLDEGFEDVMSWVLSKGAEVEDVRVGDDGVVYVSAPSFFARAQRTCRRLATSTKMASLTMFLIITNTVLMASEFYGMPKAMATAYEAVNYFITSYFALEMAVKLVGLTPRGYVADKFNIFDGVVVIVSVVELIITSATGDGGGMLSALRTGRLLRVFKLARSWPQLRNIIITILATIPSMSSLAGMLLLFIFIFDLLGMQLFGYRFIFCDSYGVEGAEPLCPPGAEEHCPTREDCYAACPAAMAEAWVSFNADTGAAGKCEAYVDPDDGEVTHYARLGVADRPRHHFDDFFWSFITIFQVLTGEDWNAVMYDAMRTVGSWTCLYFIAIVVIGNYVVLNLFLAILLDNFSGLDTDGAEKKDPDARHAALVEQKRAEKDEEEKERRREHRRDLEKKRELVKDAANVEGDERRAKAATRRLRASALRKSLESFVTHKWFDQFMLGMIVLSSCLLAVDAPAEVDEGSRLKYWLDIFDAFFVGMFVVEAALKIIALGKRYFKNGWNVLDFCIVSLGVASAAITALADAEDGNAAMAAKILRAFRTLRPLRVASRAQGMRVVVSALFGAVPAISNVALVCVLFYLIFGILGLNLFMGRMFRCVSAEDGEPVDPVAWGLANGELTKNWCQSAPRLIACVDDRRVAVYAGGDLSDDASNGFGWECVSSLAATSDALDWTYSSYGGRWTCVASANTFAVLNGTDADRTEKDVGSTFASAAIVANDAIAAAAVVARGTGVLESSCEPDLAHLEWRLPKSYDFDHIGTAMLVLFETATLEMWLDVMYHGVDATEENVHPWRDANPAACVFFVVFIVVGSFFIMNLFVGVTIDKFNEMKEESAAAYEAELNRSSRVAFTPGGALQSGKAYAQKMAAPVLARGYSGSKDPNAKRNTKSIGAVGGVLVTEEQRRWQQVEKMLMQCKPRRMLDPPPRGWRSPFFALVSAERFDGCIGVLIALNVGVMCMTHAGETQAWSNAVFWANASFAFLFLLEAIAKLIGFGPVQYIHDPWNRFDAFVVSVSVAGFALEMFTNTKASYLAILRVFRVVRVLRLVKRAKGLQTLMQTLVFSLPALFNVGSVLFLFFFIYAVMGMNLFGFVRAGEVLGRHAHFRNFPDAMATLFRSATGERWNGIMHDCMATSACVEILTPVGPYVAGDYADRDELAAFLKTARASSAFEFKANEDYVDRCTPDVGVTVFYFVSFILLCGFVMLNLVIAVILDNFESYSQSFALPVSDEDFGEFVEEWSKIDRRASYYVKYDRLPELLQRIRAPLGLKSLPKDLRRDALRRTMFTFDVEVRDNNRVHFVDVLKHLASRVDGVEDPEAEQRARSRSVSFSGAKGGASFRASFGSDGASSTTGSHGGSQGGVSKRNAVHPEAEVVQGLANRTSSARPKKKPSLLRQMSGSFVWRSSKKGSENGDWDENLDENLDETAPQPLVCHHFAAIHVQTMWKGKLARRQAELRKLKKKKRNMRRRKAEGQKPRVAAPASDDDSGAETGDEDG